MADESYRTIDHPLACGRVGHHAEEQWIVSFTKEDGDKLTVAMGRASWEVYRRGILLEDIRSTLAEASKGLEAPEVEDAPSS